MKNRFIATYLYWAVGRKEQRDQSLPCSCDRNCPQVNLSFFGKYWIFPKVCRSSPVRNSWLGNMIDFMRIALAVLLLVVSGRVHAQSPSTSGHLDIGDRAPAWGTLEGVDGEYYGSKELAACPVLVICFTSNTCPYSVDYEDRLIALQKKYGPAGRAVRVVAINSNATDGDSLKKMIDRAEQKKFNFLYLRDEDQVVAKAFGAIYTPEFFVLDRDRRVVYKGALDDSSRAEDVTRSYVELAITAIQNGTTPEVTKTGARGCAIRFPRRRRRKPDDKS